MPGSIGRRRHPGVDAEIRRHDDATPIECRRDAVPAFAAGGDEGRDHRNEHQSTHGIRVASGHARGRRTGAQRLGVLQRTRHMRIPQRQRIGVLRIDREPVSKRGRRPVPQAADAVEPVQSVGEARQAQKQKWKCRPQRERAKQNDTDGAAERRQPQPKPEPGQCEE